MSELFKRDFKKKYKWYSVERVSDASDATDHERGVFTHFFGRETEYYTTCLFCGSLVFSYLSESTTQGMSALVGNANVFMKGNVPKYLFMFSQNVQPLINFALTLVVFAWFCVMGHIVFTWR